MGRKIKLFLFACILCYNTGIAQSIYVSGTVTDSLGNALFNSNILLKELNNPNKAQFKFTDSNGFFKIPLKKKANYSIEISHIGFDTYKDTFSIKEKSIEKSFVLKQATEKLKEVFIQATPPIEVKEDTTHYRVESFLKGSERNVEDILKNLPGIDVSVDGLISINGVEIKKLMINNEDFVGKRYRLISKNLRSEAIETIDVIDKYLENKLLKGIADSEDKVINLNLKDEYSHTWFGNLDLAYDISGSDYHKIQSNLINMGGKSKYYILGNINNIGQSTGSYTISATTNSGFNPNITSIAETELLQATPYFYSSGDTYNPLSSRYTKRVSQTGSFNNITNFNDNIKWTNNLSINRNEIKSHQASITNYRTDIEVSKKQEKLSLNKEYINYFDSRLQIELSNKQNIDIKTSLTYKNTNSNNSINLNQNSTLEKITLKNQDYTIAAHYVNRISHNSIWSINTQNSKIKNPETYYIDDFIYNDLFTELNGDHLYQDLSYSLQTNAINTILATKYNKGFSYSLRAEFINTKKELNNLVYAIDNQEYYLAENFGNKHFFTKQNAFLNIRGQYDVDNIKLNFGADLHQVESVFNSLEVRNKNRFSYFKPYIGFQHITENKKSDLRIRYIKRYMDTPINSLHKNFFLMNLQFITKGFDKYSFISNETYSISHTYGKLTDIIRFSSSADYNKNKASFTSRNIIEPNYSYIEEFIGEGGYRYNISNHIDFYSYFLSTNFRLGLNYSKDKSNKAINFDKFENIYNTSWDYNFSINSIFPDAFNYKIIGNLHRNYYKSTEQQKSTYLRTYAELQFRLSTKLNLTAAFENNNYFNKNIKQSQFLDSSLHYKTLLFDKEFHFSLEGKNLLNKKKFSQIQASDIYTLESTKYLLPRMVLLSVNFGF